MNNRNIYIIAGLAIIIILIFVFSSRSAVAPTEEAGSQTKTTEPTQVVGSKTAQTTGSAGKQAAKQTASPTTSNFPEIDFMDKRLLFSLKDYPDVKLTIQQVVFGRGDAANSTGCSGIPNASFSTYLYPGSGICLSGNTVDGSPRGIVAIHMLVENNGNIGFGGNSSTLELHYLRSDSEGNPSFRFAHPLSDLRSYYINGYSSREIILSYLVPEDQLIYNLVSGYKEPALEDKTLNVYDFSVNGLQIDFGTKTLKIVK